MQVVNVEAKSRALGKKSATQKLRNEGLVPAVIYGGDKVEHIQLTPSAVRPLVYTADFKVAEVNVDGTVAKCIIKDIQFHPVTDEIQHIDFLRIVDGHPIKVVLPIQLKGKAKGVAGGGKLVVELRKVAVKLLPENLVDHLIADISDLDMGESLRVKDIQPVEGAQIMVDGAIPVVRVQIPRALLKAKMDEMKEAAKA